MLKKTLVICTLAIYGFMNLQVMAFAPSCNPVEIDQDIDTQKEEEVLARCRKKKPKHEESSSSELTLMACSNCKKKR